MAINFEPQQAYNEQIAQAYGSSIARRENQDFALRASAQAQQASYQNNALAQQNQHFYAQEANQQTLANNQQAHQSAMQESSQNFQMAHQQQGAQLQAQLSQTQLSQAEDMRRQRLERQVNHVQEQAASGSISPQEARDYTMQLRSGLDPLQERLRSAQAIQTQLHSTQMQHQIAQQTAMQTQNDAFSASALPNATVAIRNPDTGEVVGMVHPDGHGGWHQMNIHPPAPGASGAPTPQIMARFATTARNEQAREIQQAQRAGQPTPAWAANEQLRTRNRQERVAEMVQDHGGSGGTTRAGYEQDRGALMNDLTGLLNMSSPHVAPAQQAPQAPPPSTGFPVAETMS